MDRSRAHALRLGKTKVPLEALKTQLKDKKITEDDHKRITETVQKQTDAGIAQVDDIVKKKEKEVMEV